ncbi:class I SAM-dependent methyltransferase [Streptomyces sp. NPDC056224]|uniref:class I SAM-dependent methyltransferase n=1 Tax=Streptomyces sp. NPDC056224 TaxID=3345750 RepID=UPI0035E3213C
MTAGKETVRLSGARTTMLYTLYFRALDSRTEDPLVGDPYADVVFGRLEGYNRLLVRLSAGDRYVGLLRARRIDRMTREYLAAHPDAIVLHLGCGLDSRALRLDVPPTVRWYDLDHPEVIDIRRRLYPEKEGCRTIGSSVTEAAWLESIPDDGPVLVIAEGLVMYISEAEVKALFRRLLAKFEHAELIFDVLLPWLTRTTRLLGWGIDDPKGLEAWDPRLEYVEHTAILLDYPLIPARRYRRAYRLLTRFRWFGDAFRLLHYRF